MNIDIFGYFAAILTTAAFLPQLIKTLKTKKADDVSLTTLIMFIIGVLSWIIYGYKISSTPILIANLITLILNLYINLENIFFKIFKSPIIILIALNYRYYLNLIYHKDKFLLILKTSKWGLV